MAKPDGLKAFSILVDLRGRIVSFPEDTRAFIKELEVLSQGKQTLEQIVRWSGETVFRAWKKRAHRCWHRDFILPDRSIHCLAQPIKDTSGNPLLLIRFFSSHLNEDFSVLAGNGLTRSQINILNFLPLGYTNPQIANALCVKEITVKKHIQALGNKLHARGRTEILFKAMRLRDELGQ
jgi:DNA-binding NarL/FixJ family response regulator